MNEQRPKTRIQQKNRKAILDAALDVFSQHGFRGSTLDQISKTAGLSKPNVLYYFPSKEAIHLELLCGLIEVWLAPLHQLDATGDPIDEIVGYVMRKLEMSREFPRESRLFANEIIQGAPRILDKIQGELRQLVDEKCDVLQGWMDAGLIAPQNPRHLLFSIWATTQHYADFDIQVQAILDGPSATHLDDAAEFLERFFRAVLRPE